MPVPASPRGPEQHEVSTSMDQMSTWEMLLLGAVVVMVLFWIGPGVKASLEQSCKSEKKDWAGVLFPVALVILFVIFLIKMV